MRTVRRIWIVAVYLMGVAACSSSPTSPTPPPLPQVTGQYSGTYTVTRCTESGAALGSGFCAAVPGGLMVFTPQQTGSTITGTLAFGGSNISVTGSIDAAGLVVLTGGGPIQFDSTLTLSSWRGTLSGNTMTGTTLFTIATAAPIGSANMDATFRIAK